MNNSSDHNQNHNQKLLQKIANHLIINSSFLDNPGLFHGKMGIAIFFYHYSRYLNNPIYEEFAGELFDEIFEEIHDQLPINFENGYLGIGWGIEYLAHQKFIDGDTNIILEDIDKKIMDRDIRRISDMSLETGLEGIFHYVLFRLLDNQQSICLFDKQYFNDLSFISNFIGENVVPGSLSKLINCLIRGEHYVPSFLFKSMELNEIECKIRLSEWKLGMKDGCAGMGLNLMGL